MALDIPALLAGNHRRFLAFLEPRVGSRETAEEILQAAFVKATEKAAELRQSESAVAWFYRLLRNAVVDHYRHRDAEKRALERFASEQAADEALGPELERLICSCVGELASTLKPEYAALIRRVEVEGATLEQAAREAGITTNNAAVRLHRARHALRMQVEQVCRTCAEHGCIDCTCKL